MEEVMKKLLKSKNNYISLGKINFQRYSNSENWIGYYEAKNKSSISKIHDATQLFLDYFKEDIKNFILVSALADNSHSMIISTDKEDAIYSSIFELAKQKGFIQEYSSEFNDYLEQDLELPAKLLNINFECDFYMPFCELVMAYYFNKIAGQVCFLINSELQLAFYPHDDIGFGCISLNSDILASVEFLEYCKKNEEFHVVIS